MENAHCGDHTMHSFTFLLMELIYQSLE